MGRMTFWEEGIPSAKPDGTVTGGLREHRSIQMGTWRGKLEEATGEREWTWAGWRM